MIFPKIGDLVQAKEFGSHTGFEEKTVYYIVTGYEESTVKTSLSDQRCIAMSVYGDGGWHNMVRTLYYEDITRNYGQMTFEEFCKKYPEIIL